MLEAHWCWCEQDRRLRTGMEQGGDESWDSSDITIIELPWRTKQALVRPRWHLEKIHLSFLSRQPSTLKERENLPFSPPFRNFCQTASRGIVDTHAQRPAQTQTHTFDVLDVHAPMCTECQHLRFQDWLVPQNSAGSLTYPSEGITST